ncbi:HRDC-like protein [Radiomyces spectabilis]|uniref:HRDC-like protein n=1 Tax=Radiomyces spectabilis TaxID=64574 RepID=UPI00222120EA|nr:HRDC-like protein [Radiomyces spectabilis]KAI8388322.1 HRDC-like protein [Radiomyces spectabilis]
MTTRQRHLRRGGPEIEDATTLKLGEEFINSQCLYISEVRILLEAQEDTNRAGLNRQTTGVMAKTLEYVRTFSRFSNRDSVREVRQVLGKDDLAQFEVAQIANLCCEDAEEAKALIPSLANKIEDEPLQEMLNQMLTIKKFQG